MKKIERKDFLKISGGAAVGGLTGMVFSGAPFQAYQWLVEWTQDQYVPSKGQEKLLSTICSSCQNKCTISIKKVGERAVQLYSSNNLCPIGQNSLQLMYHPERVNKPYKLVGEKGSGKFKEISWETAIKEISAKMNEILKSGKKNDIAAINKDVNLGSLMVDKLIKTVKSTNSYYEPTIDTLTDSALGGTVNYDFKNSDYIISFGANLLEGWGDEITLQKELVSKSSRKLIQISTNKNRTASIADEFVPVKAGTEAILAMGMANYLITEKQMRSSAKDFSSWSQIIINKYPINTVSKLTGVSVKKIKSLANAFAKAGNPVAVSGKGGRAVNTSSVEILAVYSLNSLVKSKAVSISKIKFKNEVTVNSKKYNGIDDFAKNGSFKMLFVNEADPVYKSVFGKELSDKMKDSFVVSIMPLVNDTGLYSDYILPSLSFIESSYNGNDPVAKTASKAMHTGDIVIQLASKVDSIKDSFSITNYKEAFNLLEGKISTVKEFSFKTKNLKKSLSQLKEQVVAKAEYPLHMLPMEIQLIGDGDGMAFPYVNKSISGTIFSDSKLYVQINRATAKKHGLSDGSSIDITSERGTISSLRVRITDTIAPDVIAIPLGFGHKEYTSYAKNKGVNPKGIMTNLIDPLSGTASWWSTRVKIS